MKLYRQIDLVMLNMPDHFGLSSLLRGLLLGKTLNQITKTHKMRSEILNYRSSDTLP